MAMKIKKYSIWSVVTLLLFVAMLSPCWAGDTYNQTVSFKIGESYVMYYGTVDMTDDTVGNFYTQACFLHELNHNNAFIYAVCSEAGTEDVNVTAEYSMDRTTWLAGTAIDGLDQLGTTSLVDTINVVTGAQQNAYYVGRWIRLKFDGQTGNGDTTVSWWMVFRKNTPYVGSRGEASWYGVMNKI